MLDDDVGARATGRRYLAREVLDAYGPDVFLEMAERGVALLSQGPEAVGRVLRAQREELGLAMRDVAQAAGLDEADVRDAEEFKRTPIRVIERIARVLALDDRMVSYRGEVPRESRDIGVRLRQIGMNETTLDARATSAIAEAAWVAATQIRLQRALDLTPHDYGIVPTDQYG